MGVPGGCEERQDEVPGLVAYEFVGECYGHEVVSAGATLGLN